MFKSLFKYFSYTGTEEESWYLDLKNGKGSSGKGKMDSPDVTMNLDRQLFIDMFAGKASSTTSFMAGKLKIKGDMRAAMSLEKLLKKVQSKL